VRAARLVQPAWELILQGYYGLPLSAEDLRTAEEILLRAGKELKAMTHEQDYDELFNLPITPS